jgi:hypothetical protein
MTIGVAAGSDICEVRVIHAHTVHDDARARTAPLWLVGRIQRQTCGAQCTGVNELRMAVPAVDELDTSSREPSPEGPSTKCGTVVSTGGSDGCAVRTGTVEQQSVPR